MIVRRWLLLLGLCLAAEAQNARSYDTNDWIPITPAHEEDAADLEPPKKATGRVLNLDAPNQKFFPEDEYQRKRPQQYLRETPIPKTRQPYKFDSVPPPQFAQQPHQYQQPQLVQYIQQPVRNQQQILHQQLVAPPQNNQNYYEPNQQYNNFPFNNSYYQSLNPSAINGELLGAIQQNNQQNVPQIELTSTTTTSTTTKPQEVKENVQLLYVPLENLQQNRQLTQPSQTVYKQIDNPRQEKQIANRIQTNNNYKQHHLDNIQNDFISQALAAHKLQQQFQLGQEIVLQTTTTTTTTTPKPKKRKPHQPPLAVYMGKEGPADVKDVLEVLKHAKSIAVQDSINPESPQVFVGPSNLDPADGYTKFPLPYLSSVEGNRIERKVDQLPFFVAPLSYKTPEGYSKIPLPSPHVGSVVIKEELNGAPLRHQNQINQDFDIKNPFGRFSNENGRQQQYLVSSTDAPLNQNGLLGVSNEFLPEYNKANYETTPKELLANNYQNNAQNYQATSIKNFLNGYQPEFQTTTKPLIQNYESSEVLPQQNYQQTYKEAVQPYQTDSRETIRDYNIPTYDVKAKPTYVNNYQPSPKPQINQYESFTTPRTQPNIYSYSEEPIKQTTTSEAPLQYQLVQNAQQAEFKPASSDYLNNQPSRERQQALQQAINQYQHQINQFIEQGNNDGNIQIVSTTPAVIPTQTYDYEVATTPRTRGKVRQRGRTTTTSTTPNTIYDTNDKYTILEEFSIKPQTTTTTVKYSTDVETIPANVYKLQADHLEPVFIQNQNVKQHVLNQDMLDQQILHAQIRPQQQSQEVADDHLAPLVYNRGQTSQEVDYPQLNPYLPGLINNLQDQAVKQLLNPNLLVPTTEKLTSTSLPSTTEQVPQTTSRLPLTEAPKIETTTRRNRGRQRGNSARYSTTSTPRRTQARRRPAHTRATTVRTTTEYIEPVYETTTKRVTSRQRFRTRGRPVQVTERILHTTPTESEVAFKQPQLEGGFQASAEPSSYMQFEHTIADQQVITIKPESSNEEQAIKEYHQVYSLPSQAPSTEKFEEISSSKPVVDVQITHTVTERVKETPIITARPEEDTQYVRVNANIQSGGVIYNNRHEDSTTKSPARIRGRPRTRLRNPSTTPRARISSTTTTTTTTPKPKEESEEEFYGFIRQPNFQKPAPLIQTTTQQPQLYSATYQSPPRTIIQLEEEDVTVRQETPTVTPVRFVGEIRPKYHSTTEEPATEAPKFRTRGRIRVPARKTHQAYNEVKSEPLDDQVTRRTNAVRTRTRGKSHYKLPENLKQKSSEDEDVDGGNYPSSYLKNQETVTDKPSSFQITVDPYEEDDQVPYSSLYRPKILKNPQWVEASILPPLNDIPMEDKHLVVDSSEEPTTEEIVREEASEEIPTTTESIEITTTPKRRIVGRRRGVWKLRKQRPVDTFETAESQHYQSVLNSFDEIVKEKPTTTPAPSTTEGSLLDTLYNMFGIAEKSEETESKVNTTTTTTLKDEEIQTTTPLAPTFPEEYTEQITTTQEIEEELTEDQAIDTTIAPQTTTTTEATVVKKYEVEPWDMKLVKTSTSTEVSHETEICYKGRCVKSKEEDKTIS